MNVVITGSSSGIGQTLASRLSQTGHHVWGLARHPSQTDPFRTSHCDVSDPAQLRRCRDDILAAWTHLDALICCAAVQPPMGPAMDVPLDQWQQNININLNGTFFAIHAFHAGLLRSPTRAKVICFSGGGATSPRPNFTAYAVSKTAVVRLVENLAHEWARIPIDINAIAPGAVHTRMTRELVALGPNVVGESEYQSALNRSQSSPDENEPPKYVALTEFLLSPKSDGISGRLISAPWDPWQTLDKHAQQLAPTDIFTLRRVTPMDRNCDW